MTPRRRRRKRLPRPVSLGSLIDRSARRWKFLALARLEAIRAAWPEAAGDFVAGNVQPARLVRRQLRLAVTDASWASEMAYLAPAILDRLTELLPGDWIDELKVVPTEPWPAPEPPARPLVLAKATEAMRKRARETAAQVSDPELAAALERADLARQRRLDASPKPAVDRRRPKTSKKPGEEP